MRFPCSQDSPSDTMAVTHSKTEEMFSISVPGHETAFLRYRYLQTDPRAVEMFTTVVPPSLGGRGVGKLLADDAFNWALDNDIKMKLTCWYLSGYLQRHPREEIVKLLI